MNENCPQGINNKKNIESLGDRVGLMFEQVNKGLEKMDKKIDQLDEKMDNLIISLPKQIEDTVEVKWKEGVYGVVKWVIGGIVAVCITIAVKYIFKQ